jgi:hypothetical protein
MYHSFNGTIHNRTNALRRIHHQRELSFRVFYVSSRVARKVVACNTFSLFEGPSWTKIAFTMQHFSTIAISKDFSICSERGSEAGNHFFSNVKFTSISTSKCWMTTSCGSGFTSTEALTVAGPIIMNIYITRFVALRFAWTWNAKRSTTFMMKKIINHLHRNFQSGAMIRTAPTFDSQWDPRGELLPLCIRKQHDVA